jgi:hypothetical protein
MRGVQTAVALSTIGLTSLVGAGIGVGWWTVRDS